MTSKPVSAALCALRNCPVCGESSRKKLFPIKDSIVYQCASCGLRYLDPCLSTEAMESAYESNESLTSVHGFHEGYYDYGDLQRESKTLADFRKGLVLLEKNLPGKTREKRILDVGFGNGFFLAAASQRGWKVRGIDTSPRNLEIARKKFSLELEQGSLETISGGPEIHAISFWDVIEHLPDPHRALQKAARLLAPGGLLLIAVPNDGGLLNQISRFVYAATGGVLKKGIESIYLIEHVAYYDLKTLTRLAEMNGFARCNFFFTSTDLAKYRLSFIDRLAAQTLLTLGKLLASQNRVVAVFRKS